jgi:hypothetical protein
MDKSSKPISPLRQRMIDDMTMRNLKSGTQTGYIRAVRRLNEFLGFSPEKATAEDLRSFQLHLSETGKIRCGSIQRATALVDELRAIDRLPLIGI